MTLGLGIVGCGRFVHRYHVPALRRRDDVRLVAVSDPSPLPETVELCRETGASLVPDVEALIEGGRPDAVLVSSPHGLHAQHIERCARGGLHVLVDKPFVLRVSDAVRLAEVVAEVGVVGAVAFNRRFDSGFRHARRILDAGGLGELRHIESMQLGYPTDGWYADPVLGGGGPFVGRGTHMADIVPWLVGRPVRTVAASLVPRPDGEAVDRGGFIVGDLGGLTWSATVLAGAPWNLDEVRIFGSEGYLVVRRPPDEAFNWTCEHRDLDDGLIGRSGLGQELAALDDFVAAVCEGGSPTCSFSEAIASVAVIETAFAAAEAAPAPLPVQRAVVGEVS